MNIDKENFIKGYCERSGISRQYYDYNFVTLPCNCEYEECQGWQALSKENYELDKKFAERRKEDKP